MVSCYLLAGMSRLIHWLAVQLSITWSNKLSVPSDSQAVFFCLMNDDNLPLALKQTRAFNPGLLVPWRHRYGAGVFGSFRSKDHWFLFHPFAQCSSNLTGNSTHTCTGSFPRRAGSKSHFLTASAAEKSSSRKPADFSISTSPTRPFSKTLTLNKVTPWAPALRAASG